MNKSNPKIVILGGGSAGWITALYVREVFPLLDITVIESPDLGILGAGEGTTVETIQFLDFIRVPVSDLIINCKATIKNAIRFSNWNKENEPFYNTFGAYHPHSFGSIDNSSSMHSQQTHLTFIAAAKKGELLKEFSLVHKLSENNLTTFYRHEDTNYGTNPIERFNSFSPFAIHFDAKLFAEYLKNKGKERNIKIIEDTAEDVLFTESGYVKKLVLKNSTVKGDFFFDCSGFRRFILKKMNNRSWKSYKEYLPLDRGLPFFIDHNNKNIPPFTDSIAMDFGWVWKIPIQGRFGCGYVFDSSYTNEDKAIEELEKKFNRKITYNNVFKFDAGFYAKVLDKNVMAVGLSAGFIEPLEATSIGLTIQQLKDFLTDKSILLTNDNKYECFFNKTFENKTLEILDFLSLHYDTNKENTFFWKNFTKEHKTSDSLIEKKKKWNIVMPTKPDFYNNSFFGLHNYLSILFGLNKINPKVITNNIILNNYPNELFEAYNNYKLGQDISLLVAEKHEVFLEHLKSS